MKRIIGLALTFGLSAAAFSTACSSNSEESSPSTLPDGAVPPKPCAKDEECPGSRCSNGSCVVVFAADGIKNGDESDVDCGGTKAPRCPSGKACLVQGDCNALPCIGGVCKKPSATDGVLDNDETDVDCGGIVAPKCQDGKTCINTRDCLSAVCRGYVCRAPTSTDGVKNGDETYIDCGGTKAVSCQPGDPCLLARDCSSGVCLPTKACAPAYATDGLKNGTETDVDCGGPSAPVCAAAKECKVGRDCDSGFCSLDAAVLKCEPRKAGRKDGDETDVDCGGLVSPKCAAEKACLADRDCGSSACSPSRKRCLEGPSCRAPLGGESCGAGEVGGAGVNHESCCKSLPVTGFSDPRQPGKTVYLDKYEVTAGRMRAFVDAISGVAGVPNIKGYMAANRPSRWVNGWENALPASAEGQTETFTVTDPTTNPLYPGQDRYLQNRTQPTWSVGTGTFQFRPGLYFSLVTPGSTFFPEYLTAPGWPTADYSVIHNQNCSTTANSYGYGTLYFPDAVMRAYTGGTRYFTQDQMDVKSLNCATFAMLTSLCAWDGGQIATQEVWDYVSGNGSRLLVNGQQPQCSNGIVSGGDGSARCDGFPGAGPDNPPRPLVYYYPADGGNTHDGSARVAAPGRVRARARSLT